MAKNKEMDKDLSGKIKEQNVCHAILISDKLKVKTKSITRDD